MRMALQVLAQQIFPVIVSVGRADHGVHMISCGCVWSWQRDRALVIKLNHHHRALDSIVKHRVVICFANPRKMSFLPVTQYLDHFHGRMTRIHVSNVEAD